MERKRGDERRSTALRALGSARSVRDRAGRPAPVLDEALLAFGGEEALLLAAHQRWQVHLLARLDNLLECGPADPHDAVRHAVAELGEAMPGLAALLAEHADDPVLARAQQRLGDYVGQACPCGRRHPVLMASPQRGREARPCPLAALGRAGMRHLSREVRRHARRFAHCGSPVAFPAGGR
jgi:hypothetical protein